MSSIILTRSNEAHILFWRKSIKGYQTLCGKLISNIEPIIKFRSNCKFNGICQKCKNSELELKNSPSNFRFRSKSIILLEDFVFLHRSNVFGPKEKFEFMEKRFSFKIIKYKQLLQRT